MTADQFDSATEEEQQPQEVVKEAKSDKVPIAEEKTTVQVEDKNLEIKKSKKKGEPKPKP